MKIKDTRKFIELVLIPSGISLISKFEPVDASEPAAVDMTPTEILKKLHNGVLPPRSHGAVIL